MTHREGTLAEGRLYFQTWQAADVRAEVVIAHGYAEHSGRYGHVAAALVAAGFNAWAPDHRGHGRSTGVRGDIGSMDAVVADLDLLVDAAAVDGRPVFLLGHSMGGAIALAYAQAHQDRLRGLSLSGAAIVFPPELLALAAPAEVPDLPLADVVSSDPAVVEAYKADPLVYQGPPSPTTLGILADSEKLITGLAELTLPVQVMHGSADALIPSRALGIVVAGVSSADVTARLWPGAFHEIYNEPIKEQVISELVRWLRART
jgi:alpha-beta hydrolase superfamily lysophospholipase